MRHLFQFQKLSSQIYFLFIFLSVQAVYSQEYSVGVKAGGNYSVNDNGAEIIRNGMRYSAESNLGYQGGVFLEINLGKWLLRPEVFLNKGNGEFRFAASPSVYNLEKLSIPLLLGYNIYGPLDIYAGPAYQFILNKEIENTSTLLSDHHSNFATQLGFKMSFNRFELDLRYDFTFPSEDFQRINFNGDPNQSYFDEGRLNQLMFSLNYKLFGSDIQQGRRGRNCY